MTGVEEGEEAGGEAEVGKGKEIVRFWAGKVGCD